MNWRCQNQAITEIYLGSVSTNDWKCEGNLKVSLLESLFQKDKQENYFRNKENTEYQFYVAVNAGQYPYKEETLDKQVLQMDVKNTIDKTGKQWQF